MKGLTMSRLIRSRGFTLIELLIAIALTGVVATAVFSIFTSQSRTFDVQEQMVSLQQNLRVAIEVIERDLRWTGYDPTFSDTFFVTSVQCMNINNNGTAFAACDTGATTDITVANRVEPSILFTAFDNNFDGANEAFTYSIFDSAVDGILDLGRRAPDTGANRQRLAEGIESIGFAYAYYDGLGGLQLNPLSGAPFWAFDSDNDNVLDRHLDTDNNGVINAADNPAGALLTDAAGNPVTIQPDQIRAVQVWLLGRNLRPDPTYQAANVNYKVGNRVIPHPNDNIRRQVVSTIVKLRNLEF